MGKKARQHSPRHQYHVYNRGIDKKHIFSSNPSKHFFKQCIWDSLEHTSIFIYAYALMDNHMHFLLQGELSEVGEFMRYIQGRYAYAYNLRHNREGHLFQSTYRSKPVYDDQYFWGLVRYIHMNPVKSGQAAAPFDYPFSSFREYLHDTPSPLLSSEALLLYQKHFHAPHDFYDFHKTSDIILYDDIQEEMSMQMEENVCHALETIRLSYHIYEWTDIAYCIQLLPEIIHLLSDTYQFSPAYISRLLGVTPYHIRNILKEK